LGWAFGRQKNVLTLRRSAMPWQPPPTSRLIFHGPRHRYAANAFREHGPISITQSMNRPGKVTDNAFMESFFHSMKSETIHGCTFTEDDQILSVLRSYFPFYNRSRIHSALNYVSPATYEQQLAQ
jgi:transposase InsO family protein